jgi:hypothetical protein
MKMLRRKYVTIIFISFILAFLVTIAGELQTFGCKVWPLIHVVFWFPVVVILNVKDPATGLGISLFQFPLLALCFVIGIRRWPIFSVLATIGCAYVLMVLIALIIYQRSQ